MKKLTILIAAIALVCFSVPAMAVDWNFYGSARVNTWYVSTDAGKGGNDDSEVRWGSNGQDNARLGARVKHESVSGRIEIQLRADQGGDPSSVITTESRLAYGEWDFGAGKLLVGKAYTPIAQFISGEVFDEDLGLLGVGTMYGNRQSQLALNFGGFNIALIEPYTKHIPGLAGETLSIDLGALGTFVGTGLTGISVDFSTKDNGDVDSYIPKIEANYGMSFDTWNFSVKGGYQYYSIEDVVSLKDGKKNDVEVTSYTIGGDVGVNFGPGYVKAGLSWSRNPAQAAWHLPGLRTDLGGTAVWDGDDDTEDSDVIMAALVGGMKVSDMLSFEAGFGFRQDDLDVSGAEKDKVWELYLQSVIALAPGVYVVPEIGYIDFMDDVADNDEGSQFWLGAKWQIDF